MAGHLGISFSNGGHLIYSDNDFCGDTTMRKKSLQFASLSLSSLVLLYLLFVSVWRGNFIVSDWIVVMIDLAVKIIVEWYVLVVKD